LKVVLTSAPVLAMPDEESPFLLDVNAAQTSIGAVLSQRQQGVEKVVAHASRKLSKCKINYCVTLKELLVVVYFVKYFKHYLQGRRFTMRTYYVALQWLRKIPEPVGQQASWIGFLEEFEYDIVHRQGKLHVNADALSRRPCRAGCCVATSASVVEQAKDTTVALSDENLEASVSDAVPLSAEVGCATSLTSVVAGNDIQDESTRRPDDLMWSKQELRAAQQPDSDIKVIAAWLSGTTEKPPSEQVAVYSSTTKALWHQWSRLRLREGVLYRKFWSADG